MITQRELVSQKVSEELTDRGAQFGLILDDISIVSFGNYYYFNSAQRLSELLFNLNILFRPIYHLVKNSQWL